MPLDGVDDFAMPALLALEVDGDDGQNRGYQQENMEDEAKDQAGNHEDEIEQSRQGLPVEKQAEWWQKGCDKVNHRLILILGRRPRIALPALPRYVELPIWRATALPRTTIEPVFYVSSPCG